MNFFFYVYNTWLGHSNLIGVLNKYNLNGGTSQIASIIYILHFNSTSNHVYMMEINVLQCRKYLNEVLSNLFYVSYDF